MGDQIYKELNPSTFTCFESNAKLRKKLTNVECLGEVNHPPWVIGGCGNSLGCGNSCDFGGFRKSLPKYSPISTFTTRRNFLDTKASFTMTFVATRGSL